MLSDTISAILQGVVEEILIAWPEVKVTSETWESEPKPDTAQVRLENVTMSGESPTHDEAKVCIVITAVFARPSVPVTGHLLDKVESLRNGLLQSPTIATWAHLPLVSHVSLPYDREQSDNQFHLQMEFQCGFTLQR